MKKKIISCGTNDGHELNFCRWYKGHTSLLTAGTSGGPDELQGEFKNFEKIHSIQSDKTGKRRNLLFRFFVIVFVYVVVSG